MNEIESALTELLVATGASRTTLRQPADDDVFPVTHEARADGVGSIVGLPTPNMSRQPVVLLVQQGQQVVQDDCLAAFDDPDYRTMLELYGGMRAQIVTPIMGSDGPRGIVSLHQLGHTRAWTDAERALCSETARRVGELIP